MRCFLMRSARVRGREEPRTSGIPSAFVREDPRFQRSSPVSGSAARHVTPARSGVSLRCVTAGGHFGPVSVYFTLR